MARFPRQFAIFRAMFIELSANAGFHGLREARKSFRKPLSFLIPGGKPAFGFGVSDFTRSTRGTGHGFQWRLEHDCQETLAKAGFQR